MLKAISPSLMLVVALALATMFSSPVLAASQQQENGQTSASPDQQQAPATEQQQTPAQQPDQQNQPGQATSQGQTSSNVAVTSVTGCVFQNQNEYYMKTENDTFPLESDRDLSQLVNKRVKITGIWEQHSTSMPPTGAHSGVSAAQGEAQQEENRAHQQPPTEQGNQNAVVMKDFRVRMVGSVIGDCAPGPK